MTVSIGFYRAAWRCYRTEGVRAVWIGCGHVLPRSAIEHSDELEAHSHELQARLGSPVEGSPVSVVLPSGAAVDPSTGEREHVGDSSGGRVRP